MNKVSEIPDGWYTASIANSKMSVKPGGAERLILSFKGSKNPSVISFNAIYAIWMNPRKYADIKMRDYELAHLCKATGIKVLEDATQLHDIPMKICLRGGQIKKVHKLMEGDMDVNSSFQESLDLFNSGSVARKAELDKLREQMKKKTEAELRSMIEGKWTPKTKEEVQDSFYKQAVARAKRANLNSTFGKMGTFNSPAEQPKVQNEYSKTDIANQPHSLGPNMRKIWEDYNDRGVFGVSIALTYAKPEHKMRIASMPVDTVVENGKAVTVWQMEATGNKVMDGDVYSPSRANLAKMLLVTHVSCYVTRYAPVETVISAQQWAVARAIIQYHNLNNSEIDGDAIASLLLNVLMKDIEHAKQEAEPVKHIKGVAHLATVNSDLTSQWC